MRSVDIAAQLNVSKPSVSRAVGILKDEGYIEYDKNGTIILTKIGEETAQKIYYKHKIITQYLVSIGVGYETATKDACRIEHVLSDESFDRIRELTVK